MRTSYKIASGQEVSTIAGAPAIFWTRRNQKEHYQG